MHRRIALIAAAAALIALVGACATPIGWGSYGRELDGVSGDEWAEDIGILVEELERRHPDPYHSADRDEFVAITDALRAAASDQAASPELADAMVTGIHRALALLEEGHTKINATSTETYPVVVRRFQTAGGGHEYRIAYTDEEWARLRGARVVGIGGRAPDQVVDALTLVTSAELPAGRAYFAQRALADPRIMRGLGIASRTGLSVTVTRDGVTETILVPAVASMGLALEPPPSQGGEPSLTFAQSAPFWYETIGTTLYFQYNASTSEATDTMDEIVALANIAAIDRLILDLRFNGGGNSAPGTRFIRALSRTAIGREEGRFYVIVGPNTFSSAIMTAVDAMELTEATFTGSPLSTTVNSWGEVKRFVLPNTGLVVGHSTRFWDYSRGKELRLHDGSIVPDDGWEYAWSFEEWRDRYDPVLERILVEPLE